MPARPPLRYFLYLLLFTLPLAAAFAPTRRASYRALSYVLSDSQRVSLLSFLAFDPASTPIVLEQLALINAPGYGGERSFEFADPLKSLIQPRLESPSELEGLIIHLESWENPTLAKSGSSAVLDIREQKVPIPYTKSALPSQRLNQLQRLVKLELSSRYAQPGIWSRLADLAPLRLTLEDLDGVIAENLDALRESWEIWGLASALSEPLLWGKSEVIELGPKTQAAILRAAQRSQLDVVSSLVYSLKSGQRVNDSMLALECAWRSSDNALASKTRSPLTAILNHEGQLDIVDTLLSQQECWLNCPGPQPDLKVCASHHHEMELELVLEELGLGNEVPGFTPDLERLANCLESDCERTRVVALTRLGVAQLPFKWHSDSILRSLSSPFPFEQRAALFALGRSVGSQEDREQALRGLPSKADESMLPVLYQALGRIPSAPRSPEQDPNSRQKLDDFDEWLLERLKVELSNSCQFRAIACAQAIVLRCRSVAAEDLEKLRDWALAILREAPWISIELVDTLLPVLWELRDPRIFEALRPLIDKQPYWAGTGFVYCLLIDSPFPDEDCQRLYKSAREAKRLTTSRWFFGPSWVTCDKINEAIVDSKSARAACDVLGKTVAYVDAFKVLQFGDPSARAEMLETIRSNARGGYDLDCLELNSSTLPCGEARSELERSIAQDPYLPCTLSLNADLFLSDLSPQRLPRLEKILIERVAAGLGPWEELFLEEHAGLEELKKSVKSKLPRSVGKYPEQLLLANAVLSGESSAWSLFYDSILRLIELYETSNPGDQDPGQQKIVRMRFRALFSTADRVLASLSKKGDPREFKNRLLECWTRSQDEKRPVSVSLVFAAMLTEIRVLWLPISRFAAANSKQSSKSILADLVQERVLSTFKDPSDEEAQLFLEIEEAGWPVWDLSALKLRGTPSPSVLDALRGLASRSPRGDLDRLRLSARVILFSLDPAWVAAQPWAMEFWELALRGPVDEASVLMKTMAKVCPDSPVMSLLIQRFLKVGLLEGQLEALELIEARTVPDFLKELPQRTRSLELRGRPWRPR